MQTSNAKKMLLKLFSENEVFKKIRAARATNSASGISEIEIENRLGDSPEYVMTKDYRMAQLKAEAQRAQVHRTPRARAR